MCWSVVKGCWPTHGTPSPPICVKPMVERSIQVAMKWQPMPPIAREPSGTTVLVLCGQPEQNQGWRPASDTPRGLRRRHRALLGFEDGELRVDARRHVGAGGGQQAGLLEALGDRLGDQRRVQVGVGAQQRVRGRIGHRPFAAGVALGLVHLALVELADHVGPHVGAPVVELFLELVLDDLALFLDHQDLLQAGGELARELRLERPHHRRPCAAGCRAGGRRRRPGPGRSVPGACRCRPCRWP